MAGRNGSGPSAPSEYPPPVDPVKEFIKEGIDSEEERIDVGVVIAGGGTAGLATANRLLQLLGDDPELMESLGEVPVAVVEKAKTCGGHNLSGAVMRPGPLQELFPSLSREDWRKERFAFGEVKKDAVYMLPNGKAKLRIPTPPNFKNHGNEVISVAALARYQQRMAEEGGAYVLTETSATQLIVDDGRVLGVRSGDKGRGKDGEPLGNFEPGTDIGAKVTVLAEDTAKGIEDRNLLQAQRRRGLQHDPLRVLQLREPSCHVCGLHSLSFISAPAWTRCSQETRASYRTPRPYSRPRDNTQPWPCRN